MRGNLRVCKNDPLHLLLAMRKADRHLWRCLNQIDKGAHIRICRAKRRREPVAVLVPYEWCVLATGFQVAPEGNETSTSDSQGSSVISP